MILMNQSEYLASRLSESERYAGREVVILNFALDGYKQPQQLQLLSYYLAVGGRVDLVGDRQNKPSLSCDTVAVTPGPGAERIPVLRARERSGIDSLRLLRLPLC
jgi:hypothetical protein